MRTRFVNRASISRKANPHVLPGTTFSLTAAQQGISLPALQRLLGHDQPGHDGDLFEPQPRTCNQGVHGEVVRGRCLLTFGNSWHATSLKPAPLDGSTAHCQTTKIIP